MTSPSRLPAPVEHADLTRTFESRAVGRAVPVAEGRRIGAVLARLAADFQRLKRLLHAELAAEEKKRQAVEAAKAAKVAPAALAALPPPRGQAAIKQTFLRRHRIPGRLYNAIEGELLGLHKAVREGAAFQAGLLGERVGEIDKTIKKLARDRKTAVKDAAKAKSAQAKAAAEARIARIDSACHGKTRKRNALAHRKETLEERSKQAVPPVCFGTRRLFAEQNDLKANGHKDHVAWKAVWTESRSDQFVVKGSHEEVSGNKTCKAVVADDAHLDPQGRGRPSISLHLLLPENARVADAAGRPVTHLVMPGLRFGYGHDEIVAAIRAANAYRPTTEAFQAETKRLVAETVAGLRAQGADGDRIAEEEKALRKARNALAKAQRAGLTGAITWRFIRRADGWHVQATVTRRHALTVKDFAAGALGVDQNEGFVAVMATDGFGNPLKATLGTLPLRLVGLRQEQVMARLGDAVAELVARALAQGRPIVFEKLDFSEKKAALKETVGAKRARRFSAFAYAAFRRLLISRAARFGVRVVEVNPAYSSLMGRCLWARPLGVTVHHAASVALARRGMAVREPAPVPRSTVPVGDGRHVTLGPLAKTGRRHVWRQWGACAGAYKAGLKDLGKAAANSGRTAASASRPPSRASRPRTEAPASPVRLRS